MTSTLQRLVLATSIITAVLFATPYAASSSAATRSHATTSHAAIRPAPHTAGQRRLYLAPAPRASHLACVNGDCPTADSALVYSGGPLVVAPSVYTVIFSDALASLSPPTGFIPGITNTSAPSIAGATAATLSSSYASWWQNEYSVAGTTLRPGTFSGTIVLYNPTLADATTITDLQIQAALSSAARQGSITPTTNTIYLTFFRAGQVITDGSQTSQNAFCGYHSAVLTQTHDIYYAVMPNEAGVTSCAYAGTSRSAFENLTAVVSHELAEVVTDPSTTSGWVSLQGSEIADICATSSSSATPITYAGTDYWLQYLYSVSAQGCYATTITPTLVLTPSSPTALTATLSASGGYVQGTTITVANGPTTLATAITDATGSATLTLPAPEPGVTLTVTTPAAGPLTSTSQPLTMPTAALTIAGPTTVSPGQKISITATLSPAPAPTSVTLQASGYPSVSVTSNSQGVSVFSLTSPTQSGTYTFTASASPGTQTITTSLTLQVVSQEEITLTGPTTASTGVLVTFTVATHPPTPGVLVYLTGLPTTQSALTDASGAVVFQVNPGPGSFIVTARATMSGQPLYVTQALTVSPDPGGVTLTLSGPADAAVGSLIAIHATIVPAVAGQLVTLTGDNASSTATTNATGIASFQVLVRSTGANVYTAQVLLNAQTLSTSFTVQTVTPTMSIAAPARTSPGSPFTVVVTLSPPTAGVVVSLSIGTDSYSAATNAQGVATVTIPPHPQGTLVIAASALDASTILTAGATTTVGYPPSLTLRDITPHSVVATLLVTIRPALPGTVVTLEGAPVLLRSRTNSHGQATFHVHLPHTPRTYRALATLNGLLLTSAIHLTIKK
jgi:hypothetical protein